jgi:hypothetical protein
MDPLMQAATNGMTAITQQKILNKRSLNIPQKLLTRVPKQKDL